LSVGTSGFKCGVELTRPSAITPDYSINDVVSDSASAPTLLTFANIARVVGGSGYIVKVRLLSNQKTNVAQFRLHLFHTAPTPVNDNAPYPLAYANKNLAIGYIDFPPMTTEDSATSTASLSMWSGSLHYIAETRDIFGILETRTTFTPTAGQLFYIEMSVDNN